jgi:hypothetical protein
VTASAQSTNSYHIPRNHVDLRHLTVREEFPADWNGPRTSKVTSAITQADKAEAALREADSTFQRSKAKPIPIEAHADLVITACCPEIIQLRTSP